MSEETRREGGADMARHRSSIPTVQCVWESQQQ